MRSWKSFGEDARPPRSRHGRDEEATASAATLRALCVMPFAETRAAEIQTLWRDMTSVRGNRRAFQTLPRHLRRRTMSHNIYRIPVRLRRQAKREMNSSASGLRTTPDSPGDKRGRAAPPPSTAKRCRKHRRRAGLLLADFARRQREYVWLETHIWHAKRFHMRNAWGYRLPEEPTDKSVRFLFKATTHSCTIHDASYFATLELEGTEAHVLMALRPYTNPSLSTFGNGRMLDGRRRGWCLLYHRNQYPGGCIAPVPFCWKPPSPDVTTRTLWIEVHPSVVVELEHALCVEPLLTEGHVKMRFLTSQLALLELRGPRTHEVLGAVLREKEPSVAWKTIQSLRSPGSFAVGTVVSLCVTDPRLPMQPVSPPCATRSSSLPIELPVPCSALWDERARRQMTDEKPSDSVVNEWRRVWRQAHSRRKQSKGGDLPPAPGGRAPELLLMHVPGYEGGFGAGWDILLPAGWTVTFWKAFLAAGARVMGLRDRRRMFHECGFCSFPEDYPDTVANRTLVKTVESAMRERYLRRPPAKRVNFVKLRVPHPFRSPWNELTKVDGASENEGGMLPSRAPFTVLRGETAMRALRSTTEPMGPRMKWIPKDRSRPSSPLFQDLPLPERGGLDACLVRVVIHMASRGCPTDHAAVCAPAVGDYERWRLNRTTCTSYPVQTTCEQEGSEERAVIGYVTSGFFSFRKGHGMALAFCRVRALLSLQRVADIIPNVSRSSRPFFLLTRNTTSPFFRPAFATIEG